MTPSIPTASRLPVACVVGFSCFFASYLRMPIVPLLAASLGADAVQVGLVNGVFMLTACVLSIPSGLISDRLGRRIPLLGGLLLLALSSFLLFFSANLPQMGVIYLFFGIGMSTFSPALMAYVGDVTPPQSRGRAFGWYTMAMYGGMTLGPAAAGFLAKAFGLRQVFPAGGIVLFAMFLVALFFLPMQESTGKVAQPGQHLVHSLLGLTGNRPLTACLLAVLGSCVGYGTFVSFMPLYLKQLGMDTVQVGLVFAAGALTNTLSRLPAGRLCDRVRDRGTLVSIGLGLFALALAGFGTCRSVLCFALVSALMGLGMGLAYTVICAMIADSVAREMRGLAVGCYNTCIYAGMLLAAIGIGPLVKAQGFQVAFFSNGALGAAVLVLFKLRYRPRPGAAAQTVAASTGAPSP